MARILAIKLDDEVYEELLRRSRRLGYTLLADYVRDILLREISEEHKGVSREDLEVFEDKVRTIVERIIREKLASTQPREFETRLLQRLERKVQDLLNPWTSKIDQLASRIANVSEVLEELRTRLDAIERRLQAFEAQRLRAEKQGETGVRKKRTAIERLREQGVVFESEVQWLRDRAAFFERLRREGALVIEVAGERIAIDRDFWRKFVDKLSSLTTSNDDELSLLLTSV
ncbi:MAG: hypothetical protein ABWW69_05865, partial [Pyrodictiaceae archaeon]